MSKQDKKSLKSPGLGVLWFSAAFVASLSALAAGRELLVGPFPMRESLPSVYFVYSLSVLVSMHLVFFVWDWAASEGSAPEWPRNLPKAIEYLYAGLISFGLVQVFTSSPDFSRYVTFSKGTDTELVAAIVQQARIHLRDDCASDINYFTNEYCEKLEAITQSASPAHYIKRRVLEDRSFLDHVTGVAVGASQGGASVGNQYSPIRGLANALKAARHNRKSGSGDANGAARWLAMLILPVGISLRFLKTSIELFGSAHR